MAGQELERKDEHHGRGSRVCPAESIRNITCCCTRPSRAALARAGERYVRRKTKKGAIDMLKQPMLLVASFALLAAMSLVMSQDTRNAEMAHYDTRLNEVYKAILSALPPEQ